ncbi:MAG: MBL fold metallo-hydrolase [Acidobacteriota bacterium]|jgi:L-ascorbate metabolism protein UlaG (beta-lactamase superfamily)
MNGSLLVRFLFSAALLCVTTTLASYAQNSFQTDVIKTSGGDLNITFIGHGTLMFEYSGKVIDVDPVSMYADFSKLPKADLILVTHEHADHLDPKAIEAVKTPKTTIIINPGFAKTLNPDSAKTLAYATVMRNGETKTVTGITIEAVPAYNPEKPQFHPRGNGNGYVLTFGGKRVFVAGDTENVPEIKALRNIDVAFLPMNLPFTMTPEQVADVAKSMRPKILYPYHYGNTDPQLLVNLLRDEEGIEVRVRNMR